MKRFGNGIIIVAAISICAFVAYFSAQNSSEKNSDVPIQDEEVIARGHGGHGGHHHGHHGHHRHHGRHHHGHGYHHNRNWGHRGAWSQRGYWNGNGYWNNNPGYYYDPNYYYNVKGTTGYSYPTVQPVTVPVQPVQTIIPQPVLPVQQVPSLVK